MRSYGVDTCQNKAFYNLDLGNIINLIDKDDYYARFTPMP